MVRRASVLIIAIHTLLPPRQAGGQVTVVEEGTFSLLRQEVRIGREDFSIRRVQSSSGTTMIAQANVTTGEVRRTVVLTVDSAGYPLRYSHETFQAGRSAETTTGESRGTIWSGRTLSLLGESAREFRLPPGTLAGDEDIAHQVWFLLRFRTEGPMGRLAPRAVERQKVVLSPSGSELLRFGTVDVAAQRWVIRAGDLVVQEVWTDSRGRLLRVRFPTLDLDAVRDDIPR
ncbi:MAG: hypothetical protein ACKOC2_07065 [Gemmatimonadota bacterium]